MRRNLFRCKRGLETVTSIFLLLLMITTMTILIVVFNGITVNSQSINNIDLQRAKEHISLQETITNDKISSLTVSNNGDLEVRIRAIYQLQNGITTFVGDPTVDHINFQPAETYIPPSKYITINFQAGHEPNKAAIMIAATQLGTKSLEYQPGVGPTPPPSYAPTDLVIGSLLIKFENFKCQSVPSNGAINPGAWQDGWVIPKDTRYCAWKIKVTNIDDRDITISRFSSFTPVANGASTSRSWYIEPTDSSTLTQFLKAGEENDIIFIWDAAKNLPGGGSNTACSFYSFSGVSSVFLTFYGVHHELDGATLTPFAQTIPFEGAISTK